MPRSLLRTLLVVGFLFLAGTAVGAEPAAVVVQTAPPVVMVPPLPYRRSAYEVWQYYGVDRSGHFRPRVIATPYGGAYYPYDGRPYPWMLTHQRDIMPYVVD